MAGTLQHVKVSCRGGLDLRSSSQELLSSPGGASILDNFECDHRGGYRRINGYTSYGDNSVPGSGTIKGIKILDRSIIVAKGTNLYHTFDTVNWVQINKEVVDANYTTISAATAVSLDNNSTYVDIIPYSHGTSSEEQIITIVNGYDKVMVFTISGTTHLDAEYTFEFLDPTTTSAPKGAAFGTLFKDQVYLSGQATNPSSVFISTLTNPKTYNGTLSSEISTADPVTGLKPFRDIMVVFCENSISSIKEANTALPTVTAITKNIGCVSGKSVQEIGGDLVFLSQDGLRSLAATDRIDDVELSTISSKINPFLQKFSSDFKTIGISSVVLRNKNQYRLYFSGITDTTTPNKGVIGTLITDDQGNLGWNWSLTKDLEVTICEEGYLNNRLISLMSSGTDGNLYQHDTGSKFNTDKINAIFRTHYFDLNDPSVRKNVHRVRTYVRPEGHAEVGLQLKYTGYLDDIAALPARYLLEDLKSPSIYRSATYNTNYVYGALELDNTVINTEGSGFTIALSYDSNKLQDTSYNIQGFDLDIIVSGKV